MDNFCLSDDFIQNKTIEQKGMTFDHDFGYYFPLFTSLLKKEEREKENEVAKNRDQKSFLSARSNKTIILNDCLLFRKLLLKCITLENVV